MAGKLEQAKGQTKEAVGSLTGNKDLESQGKADRRADHRHGFRALIFAGQVGDEREHHEDARDQNDRVLFEDLMS